MKNIQEFSENYQAPNRELWAGRKSNPDLGNQYWHQAIELKNLLNLKESSKADIALIGYACDEGVKRNLGRVGAKDAPPFVRERLAKLAFHHSAKKIIDVGDMCCIEDDLETCQEAFSAAIHQLLSKRIFPIAIGGGHDIAYAHFLGIWESLKNQPNPKIGILNFDAHFDLRRMEGKATSGTPFYQILNEFENQVTYFALGIQQNSNTPELFEIAQTKKVQYIYNDECQLGNFQKVKQLLENFISQNDWIYITIDVDGFSSAYAPGVSAPSPMGFEPFFVMKVLEYLFSSQKIISLDFAEFNPKFDIDNDTASLVARLVDFVVGLTYQKKDI